MDSTVRLYDFIWPQFGGEGWGGFILLFWFCGILLLYWDLEGSGKIWRRENMMKVYLELKIILKNKNIKEKELRQNVSVKQH